MSYWLLTLLLALGATVLYACSGGSTSADIAVPAPAAKRHDLLYGYYTSYADQPTETKGHVNLFWAGFWQGEETAISDMQLMAMPTVIDLDGYLFQTTPNVSVSLSPTAEANVRGLFDRLRAANVLRFVRVLYPRDEPNLPDWRNCMAYLPQAVSLIRRVAASYQELVGVKVGVIYYDDGVYPSPELFDILGVDNYQAKSSILAPGGAYARLKARLSQSQQTWVVPGGSYGQDPTPFLNYAQDNPEVFAVVPFLWADLNGETGIRSIPAMRSAYTSAGLSIINQ